MPTYAPVWQIFPTPLGSQKHRSSFSEAIPGSSGCATQVRASTSTQGPASTDPSPEGHGFMTSCATCKAQPAEMNPDLNTSAPGGDLPKSSSWGQGGDDAAALQPQRPVLRRPQPVQIAHSQKRSDEPPEAPASQSSSASYASPRLPYRILAKGPPTAEKRRRKGKKREGQ